MNKKGTGPIGAIILFLVFIAVWFVWLGSWLNETGRIAVTEGGATGIEAFFYSNLNFVIFICMLLGIMGWIYFGGGE